MLDLPPGPGEQPRWYRASAEVSPSNGLTTPGTGNPNAFSRQAHQSDDADAMPAGVTDADSAIQ
jgi:hypothetical protein